MLDIVPAPALSTAEEKDAKRAEVGRLIALAAQPPQLIAAAKQADKPYLIDADVVSDAGSFVS